MNDFGIKVKQLRKAKNMKQDELARLLKISTSAVSMYEQNRREPDNKTIVKIATIFGVTTDYLLDNTTQEKKPVHVDEPLKNNTVIYHRDGETVMKEFSPEQMQLIAKLIEEIPSNSKN